MRHARHFMRAPPLVHPPGHEPPAARSPEDIPTRRQMRVHWLSNLPRSEAHMSLRTRASLMVLAVVIAATGLVATAQRAVTTGPQNAPLTALVPVDPRITVGTLPNGLRYYLRANQRPERR